MTARIFRWRKAFRGSRDSAITAVEYRKAIHIHVRQEQERHFARDIQLIRSGKQAAVTPSLLQLAHFLDDQGLLRVGGRLQHSDL